MNTTIVKGEPIKSRWGQWYRHDRVLRDGIEIGRIQVRRLYYGKRIGHRIETMTLGASGGAVMGSNVAWLEGNAGNLPQR